MAANERFDRLAEIYDTGIRLKVSQYDELQEVFFNLLPFAKDAHFRVLDLGVGTAITALTLLQKYPKAELIGGGLLAKNATVRPPKTRPLQVESNHHSKRLQGVAAY